MSELAREPCLKPTVPPPDEDARWIYSSGSPSRQGPASPAARKRRPTITLSSLVLTKCHSDPGETAKRALGGAAFSPNRSGEGNISGGTGGAWIGRGDGTNSDAGAADRTPPSPTPTNNSVGGSFACDSYSAADVSPATRLAVGAPSPTAGVGASNSPANRQKCSRETPTGGGGRDRSMRRCRSTGEARLRPGPRSQVSKNPLRGGCGAERSGAGYGATTRPSWSPAVQAAKAQDRKMRSALGFGNGGGSCLGAVFTTPSVSPWCRQTATPSEWGGPPGELLDGLGQDRGVVGWGDDASGSNA